jgi:putative serine protease PepD
VQGSIEGTSPEYDLAVIKIDVDGLTPLVFGDSDAILVGDQVIAIGSPLGLDSTVTTGIISAMHRPVTTGSDSGETAFLDALQTDAAINPGNSGGPLLNSNGEVIGINSAVAALPGATQSTGAGSVGLGFAIPSNVAYRVAQELIETGEATVPVMGAVLDTSYTGSGVKIADSGANPGEPAVAPGSPADIAGILAGDVITHINGRPVSRADEVVVAVRSLAPGDSVAVTVETDGEPREVTVTVVASTEISYGDGADAESTQD